MGLLCKRAQYKRRYSAKETCNLIDPTSRSHPIVAQGLDSTVRLPLRAMFAGAIALSSGPSTASSMTLFRLSGLVCKRVPMKLSVS